MDKGKISFLTHFFRIFRLYIPPGAEFSNWKDYLPFTNYDLSKLQGLLAVPFVLHSQPTALYQENSPSLALLAARTHDRYVEIMHDVESLIDDHSNLTLCLYECFSHD